MPLLGRTFPNYHPRPRTSLTILFVKILDQRPKSNAELKKLRQLDGRLGFSLEGNFDY